MQSVLMCHAVNTFFVNITLYNLNVCKVYTQSTAALAQLYRLSFLFSMRITSYSILK